MSKTCIVIPCYNEENRLSIETFRQYIASNPDHFIFVDDGSSDQTFSIIEQLANQFPDLVKTFQLENNSGKAEAVRQGILESLSTGQYDYVGYFDADLATPLSEINNIRCHIVPGGQYSFAMGSRIKRLGTKIERTTRRHILGRAFATAASWLNDIPVYDSQCGAKLFSRDLAELIFSKPFISKWIFDIELILRTQQAIGKNQIIEVPLQRWSEKKGSKIRASHSIAIASDLIRISRTK